MTEKLYYVDSYISEFSANVVLIIPKDDKFEIVLDKTAFFPEEGGQRSDRGYIGSSKVIYVHEKENIIYHVVDSKPDETSVFCKIDFEDRFDKMQQHTAELCMSRKPSSSSDELGCKILPQEVCGGSERKRRR